VREAGPGKNIILIGMPGSGKSTIGVLLAKSMARDFVDTDLVIQSRDGRRLQEIFDQDGLDAFCRKEETCVLELSCSSAVIATGGSVVYSRPAMDRLRRSGVVLHLDLDLEHLKERLPGVKGRGIVMKPGQSLEALYAERMPLYRGYADYTIRCDGKDHEGVLSEILSKLSAAGLQSRGEETGRVKV